MTGPIRCPADDRIGPEIRHFHGSVSDPTRPFIGRAVAVIPAIASELKIAEYPAFRLRGIFGDIAQYVVRFEVADRLYWSLDQIFRTQRSPFEQTGLPKVGSLVIKR